MNPAIETRELCYTYEDGTTALDHVSLKAERGRITGILGANGAGKSTLFLNLNGVLTPQSGEVLLDGAPVRRDRKGLAELRRRVGIVFQDPDDQLFSADVYRDISFGAVNLGLPEAEVRRRVEQAMERTGVSALRDKLLDGLSALPYARVTGSRDHRLPGTASFVFEGVEGEALLLHLDARGICASSGSACSSASLDPSHVLLAIGLPHAIAHGSLRLSLGADNTDADVDAMLAAVPEVVAYLRNMSPVWDAAEQKPTWVVE